MKKYVLKRLLSLIPTIFIVSVVIFLLVHLTPGDPAAAMLGEDATAAEIAALHTQLGLDDPLVVQYFRWVGNCLRLDFGTSTAVVNKPVSEMIASHFQPTILLAIYSQLITILIAIPCGMLAAKKRGTIADYFVSVLSMLGISLPSFLMGLGMVLLFAVNLRVLPAAGYKNPFTDGFLPFLRYMTLPAVSLGFIHAGYMMRMTKASMLEVLGSDYFYRYPHEFSGGQRQRIGLARALILDPKIVVCDEPVSALDVSIQSQIINLLKELQRKRGLTYLFVAHDMSVIRYISDRVGVMYLGHLVEEGDTDEVFDHPQHPYTRTLMSAVPSIDPRDNRQRILLEGDLPSPIDPPSGCVFHTRCPWATEACKTASCELREVRKGHYAACSRGEQE